MRESVIVKDFQIHDVHHDFPVSKDFIEHFIDNARYSRHVLRIQAVSALSFLQRALDRIDRLVAKGIINEIIHHDVAGNIVLDINTDVTKFADLHNVI